MKPFVDPVDAVFWGVRVWRAFRPWRRLKIARNKRRARLGKPLLPIEDDDMNLFPSGTMTKTGGIVAMITAVLVVLLHRLGIGECSPDALAAMPTCVGATEMAGMIVTLGAGVLVWVGRNRAQAQHVEALTATAQASADAGTPVVVAKPPAP